MSQSIYDKALEVQEAAAAAHLAEREDFIDLLKSDPEVTQSQAEDLADSTYPSDPYSMDEITEIPGLFLWLSLRYPNDLESKRAATENGAGVLNGLLPEGIASLTRLLDGDSTKFSGTTLDTLVNFLDLAKFTAMNHGSLAADLERGVSCMKRLLDHAAADVIDIADKTKTALNAIEEGGSGSMSGLAFALAGALVGSVAAIATAPAGGVGVALTFALIQGGIDVVASSDTNEGTESDHVSAILSEMKDELGKREDELKKAEEKLVKGLEADLAGVNGKGASDFLDNIKVPVGGLADKRGNFHDNNATAANLHDLYKHATVDIPHLANEFALASSKLDGANGTESIAMGLASAPWEQLLDKLQTIVARASKDLYGAGETLALAAQDFARQDGVTAGWIDENAKKLVHKGKESTDPVFPTEEMTYPESVYGPTYVP